jgi:uncharacterized protein (DUF2062 family)
VLRRLLDRARGLLQLDDPPWRIALALAIGVFISCTPTFGFQTVLAILVATVARLNRAATVTGVWLNLPWVTPFVYAGALKLGQVLLPQFGGVGGFWVWLIVGTTIVGVAAGLVTYFVSFGALSWRRRRRTLRDVPPPGPETACLGVVEAAAPGVATVPERREPAA